MRLKLRPKNPRTLWGLMIPISLRNPSIDCQSVSQSTDTFAATVGGQTDRTDREDRQSNQIIAPSPVDNCHRIFVSTYECVSLSLSLSFPLSILRFRYCNNIVVVLDLPLEPKSGNWQLKIANATLTVLSFEISVLYFVFSVLRSQLIPSLYLFFLLLWMILKSSALFSFTFPFWQIHWLCVFLSVSVSLFVCLYLPGNLKPVLWVWTQHFSEIISGA